MFSFSHYILESLFTKADNKYTCLLKASLNHNAPDLLLPNNSLPHFPFFQECFQKTKSPGSLKIWIICEMVNTQNGTFLVHLMYRRQKILPQSRWIK